MRSESAIATALLLLLTSTACASAGGYGGPAPPRTPTANPPARPVPAPVDSMPAPFPESEPSPPAVHALPSILKAEIDIAFADVEVSLAERSALDSGDFTAAATTTQKYFDVFNLYFDTGATEVGSADPERDAVTRMHLSEARDAVVLACGSATIYVFGASDPSGDPMRNVELSEQRASSVLENLQAVAGNCDFRVFGLGPIDADDDWQWETADARPAEVARFRRVDVWVAHDRR